MVRMRILETRINTVRTKMKMKTMNETPQPILFMYQQIQHLLVLSANRHIIISRTLFIMRNANINWIYQTMKDRRHSRCLLHQEIKRKHRSWSWLKIPPKWAILYKQKRWIYRRSQFNHQVNSNKFHFVTFSSISFHPFLCSDELTVSPVADSSTTNDCYYCDYKTNDIEELKSHIIAHIRDKNYRCLLCNRLYKYRGRIPCFIFTKWILIVDPIVGDCSFHIRRKHHRYSVNSNDYIQRFLFDTSDGDETTLTQSGGQRSSTNGSNQTNHGSARDQEEPVRYFGCPYCDYTSNYGGDVR